MFVACCSCGNSPKVLWKFQTGGPVYSSPAVAGQNLIIASTDGNLYALNLQSGATAWKRKIAAQAIGTPLVRNGRIYVGGGKGDMFCLDEAGNIQWQFHTKASIHYEACADESGIYFGSRDFSFYKLSYDGAKLWEVKTGYYLWGTCSFHKDLVYTSAWDFNLYALDRNTGAVRWKDSAGIQIYGSPLVLNDQVYYATHSKIKRLDAATGKLLNVTNTTYLDEVMAWNGFLWTNEGGLTKRDLRGNEIANVPFRTTPAIKPVYSGKYFILGGVNILYGVSPELKILWKFKADDDFWITGVVADGAYYIGNRDFFVYALKLP